MTNEQDPERILGEAHEHAAALDRRDERKEVYLAVAKAMLTGGYYQDHIATQTSDPVAAINCMAFMVRELAEAIYQGMLKFAGEIK
jgi:hypothetical protein